MIFPCFWKILSFRYLIIVVMLIESGSSLELGTSTTVLHITNPPRKRTPVNSESSMPATIRPAAPDDIETVSSILQEAARWLEQTGQLMWRDSELLPSRIAEDVRAGLFFIAVLNTEPAGTIKFQLEDPLFWPDVPHSDSAFVHRLAVRRHFAGTGISTALMNWAADRARSLNKRYLRLDCEASRPKLRAVYERFGFRHHSNRQVGPYFVSRYEYSLAGS